ncbi:MAG: hypothetical protein K2K65_01055, partial [Duncaniella sp.]|nr:hypothetical protein [Duncaniella sp.]
NVFQKNIKLWDEKSAHPKPAFEMRFEELSGKILKFAPPKHIIQYNGRKYPLVTSGRHRGPL